MGKLSTTQMVGGVVVLAALIAGGAILLNQGGGVGEQAGQVADSGAGIDVSNTDCEGIGAARTAVNEELTERTEAAGAALDAAMEAASDAYWETRRALEAERQQCGTEALLADPCKDLFERSSQLAQQILQGVERGDGFDEAMFDEREQVKKDYDDCVENPPEEDTYEGQAAACNAVFEAGDAAALGVRSAAETAATGAFESALLEAQADHASKHATLDAIEEECNKPPPETQVSVGHIGGTDIQGGSSACTGRFAGFDPEIQSEISRIQTLFDQARAGGKTSGLGGSDHLGARLSELKTKMAAGPRKCQAAADCGDTTPVCCSTSTIGEVACSDGICINEITECEDPSVCAGEPAQCVDPTIGEQSGGISITSGISVGESCSNQIQVLDLQMATPDSYRYEITGNVPSWLGFSPPGGALPQKVKVTASCSTLKGFGPGTYTAEGTIQIYNHDNELINTIPWSVTITVTD